MEDQEQQSLVQNQPENSLLNSADELLAEVRAAVDAPDTIRIPFAQLALLGGTAASLCPALRTVTQMSSFPADGLYRWVNGAPGDVLKAAKNGNLWGASHTADGGSKLAQFQAVSSVDATSVTQMPFNPVTAMTAAALFSIEKKLDSITETSQQILSFLEREKESEIEAHLETLCDIISNYKFNLENELFVSSNHSLAVNFKADARGHMISYQKKLQELLHGQKHLSLKARVQPTLKELQKDFQYYRLSLYTFSMSSLLEVILSRNFDEQYISALRSEIEAFSMDYRELFSQCSGFLEKKSHSSLGANVLKGVGSTSHAVGKLIGSIPVIRRGQADEFLQENGGRLREKADELEQNILEEFSRISNPGTHVFMEKMSDLIRIYNHTSQICFDRDNLYLIPD